MPVEAEDDYPGRDVQSVSTDEQDEVVGTNYKKHFSTDNETYMALPSVRRPKSLEYDVDELNAAFSGCGIDSAAITRVLVNRTEKQIKYIRQRYVEKYKVELDSVVKQKCGGHFREAVMTCVRGQAWADAMCLKTAIEGIGTDEDRMQEILCCRSPLEVERIKEQYFKITGKDLREAVDRDTSWSYGAMMEALVDPARYIAEQLHETMHGESWDITGISGIGTNEFECSRILLSVNRSNDNLKGILGEFDDNFDSGWAKELSKIAFLPDIADVVEAYQNRIPNHNKKRRSLEVDIKSETSWDYKKMLLLCIEDKHEGAAQHLHDSLHAKRRHRETILCQLMSLSDRGRQLTMEAYEEKFGISWQKDLQENMIGGDWKRAIGDLSRPRHEKWADYLHVAMHGKSDENQIESKNNDLFMEWTRTGMMGGWGTDEDRMTRIIANATRGDIKALSKAYKAKYGEVLQEAIDDETSFDYQQFLLYKFHQAKRGFVHVPRRKLVRLADVSWGC